MENNFDRTKTFSKERWLVCALASKDRGILNQREIDDACRVWVDELDGKTVAEVEKTGLTELLREDWLQ